MAGYPGFEICRRVKKLRYLVILQDEVGISLSKLLYRIKWNLRLIQFSLIFRLSSSFIPSNCTEVFPRRGQVLYVWNRLKKSKWWLPRKFSLLRENALGLLENHKISTFQMVFTCQSWKTILS